MKTIIIGDIHGCYNELIELLEKAKFNENEDILVINGDVMDRGELCYEAYSFVLSLKRKMRDRWHYLMGNHELMLCNANYDRSEVELWKYNGGNKTIKSFYKVNKNVYNEALWLTENTEKYYETDDYIVCHGGIVRSIEEDSIEDIVWDRNCVSYGKYSGKLLIVGHTPLNNVMYFKDGKAISLTSNQTYKLEPYSQNDLDVEINDITVNKIYNLNDYKTGCIDIDTGCVFGYKLTAMLIEEDKFSFVSVKKGD